VHSPVFFYTVVEDVGNDARACAVSEPASTEHGDGWHNVVRVSWWGWQPKHQRLVNALYINWERPAIIYTLWLLWMFWVMANKLMMMMVILKRYIHCTLIMHNYSLITYKSDYVLQNSISSVSIVLIPTTQPFDTYQRTPPISFLNSAAQLQYVQKKHPLLFFA